MSRIPARGVLVEGDGDSAIHPLTAPVEGDIIVTKRRVSAFTGTDLEIVLRSLGVGHLVLAGIITSGAVLSTMRQAADLDFELTVVRDLCLDRDAEVHDILMDKVLSRQGRVISSTDWIKELEHAA